MPDESPPTDSGDDGQSDSGDTNGADAADDGVHVREEDLPAGAPPVGVIDEVERLTRLARDAVDDAEAEAYRKERARLLDAHDYTARVRADETRDVLVVHPDDWVEDGTIRPERIEDLDRGIERPLSGPGEGDDWEEIDAHNREIVSRVRDEHGEVHAANAEALADFMGNHYAKPIESATREELEEFLDEYYPRNAWPTDEQRTVVEKSVAYTFEVADERCPIEALR